MAFKWKLVLVLVSYSFVLTISQLKCNNFFFFSGTTWPSLTWRRCRATGPKSCWELVANCQDQEPHCALMFLSPRWWNVATVSRLRVTFHFIAVFPTNGRILTVNTQVVKSRFFAPAGLRNNKPLFAIRKSFKVENVGELPLTVMSMNINGYKCQGFGFEVLQCSPFSLNHNTSAEITVA